jgi:hypothetical protein
MHQPARVRDQSRNNFRSPSRRKRLAVAAAAAACAAAAASFTTFTPRASAAPRSWIANDGNWSTPGNWSTNTVPQAGDEALITTAAPFGRLITYDYTGPAITLGAFRLGGGLTIPTANSFVQNANVLTTNVQEVGLSGRASYSLSGGTNTVGPGGLFVGVNPSSRGAYFLSGSGALSSGTSIFGVAGTATFGQSGGTFNTQVLNLAENATAVATYDLSAGALTVGQFSRIGQAGAATFNHTGGTHNATWVVVGTTVDGRGTYALSGTGSLAAQSITVAYDGTGTFLHTSGTSTTNTLYIGASTGSSGTYTLSDNGLLRIDGSNQPTVYVGGSGAGTFIQTGGTHRLFMNAQNTAPALVVGSQGGGTGTYLLSGGLLDNAGALTIGASATGTGLFEQSGGTHKVNEISIGSGSSAFGTYRLSGTGKLDTTTSLTLGAADGGAGSFLQSGGTHNLGIPGQIINTTSAMLNLGTTPGAPGYYELSGGTLNVFVGLSGIGAGGGNGTFNQTGGTHNYQGLLLIGGDLSGGSTTGSGTYRLTGGRLIATPVSVGNILTLDGLRLLGGGTFEGGATDGVVAGKFTQDGGTVNGVLRNEGTFVYKSGAFAGELVNRGTALIDGTTFTSTITIDNQELGLVTGNGTIGAPVNNRGTIAPAGTLATTQLVTNRGLIRVAAGSSFVPAQVSNLANINVAGGTIPGNGSIANQSGGVIAGGGLIQAQVVQNGGIVRADDPNLPLTITGNIVTNDPSSQFVVAHNATMNLPAPLNNSAVIALQGAGATLGGGGAISNSGTIRGAGRVNNAVTNTGVIRPEGGALVFTGGVSNAGSIVLSDGAAFDSGNSTMTNTGAILGRGTLRGSAINNAGGSITFSGGVSDVFPAIGNGVGGRITLTGGADANFFGDVTSQTGSISVGASSTAVFFGRLIGLDHITGSGAKVFEGQANGGPIRTTTGTTIVGASGDVTADYLRDDVLRIGGGLSIRPAQAGPVSRVNLLTIDGSTDNWSGQLDLEDNDFVIDYAAASPLATIQNQLKSGYANGAWTGNGIVSSDAATATHPRTALGYADAAALNLTSFDGEALDGTTVVIAYTAAGDANLDRVVNLADFNRLASNFGQIGRTWVQGDFNYDEIVNLGDFNLLASNFGLGAGADGVVDPQDWSALAAAVPEPSMISLPFATAALAQLARRVRRNWRSA